MIGMSTVKKAVFILFAQLAALVAASAVFAAAGDPGDLLKDFLYRVLNFTVAFGLLAYFAAKPIRKGLAARREAVAHSLEQAKNMREEAEAKFAEYETKLNKASAEIDEIYASIRREGELEREKILANAREMAEKIKAEAERTASNEVSRARAELRAESAALAIAIAEDLLKKSLTPQDQNRLVEEYMKKVGELH